MFGSYMFISSYYYSCLGPTVRFASFPLITCCFCLAHLAYSVALMLMAMEEDNDWHIVPYEISEDWDVMAKDLKKRRIQNYLLYVHEEELLPDLRDWVSFLFICFCFVFPKQVVAVANCLKCRQ